MPTSFKGIQLSFIHVGYISSFDDDDETAHELQHERMPLKGQRVVIFTLSTTLVKKLTMCLFVSPASKARLWHSALSFFLPTKDVG